MTDQSFANKQALSYLSADNTEYLESLYESYLDNPQSVDAYWQQYFQSLSPLPTDKLHKQIITQFKNQALNLTPASSLKQAQVWEYIDAYRKLGHFHANLDPLGLMKMPACEALSLAYHGLSEADLNDTFETENLSGMSETTLRNIATLLKKTYCGSIGFEYAYKDEIDEVAWLQQRIESVQGHPPTATATQLKILDNLVAAEGLEKYLGKRYVGQKRFGLDGGESLIPLLNQLIDRLSLQGTKEIVFGMAHRGRLNVLVNIMGRSPYDLFLEFEGKSVRDELRSGDVKYHLGFASNIPAAGGPIHLALAFNPSHLEIISPVVEGSVRARQQYWNDTTRDKIIPVQIHGDAAFAGQGVVMETFTLSQTRGFTTGGSIHIIINNQIGFTTSDIEDARSTFYCTDVGKMIGTPIFHVNGDDPDAVVFVAQLAADYRMKFHKDVIIDLICYRRFGHNEADEPSATQPVMYRTIRNHATTLELYTQQLIAKKLVTQDQVDQMSLQYRDALDKGNPTREVLSTPIVTHPDLNWKVFLNQPWNISANTALSLALLKMLAARLETLPEGFTLQPQVKKIMDERRLMTEGKIPVNWGYAEVLAYATLLYEGHLVRLSGEDSARGTFFHRHVVLYDYNTGATYTPLNHVDKNQARFVIVDSALSENAVLAFEYGYASSNPNALVLWEAQYGDFANGAQVVIDQFISSGDQKWRRLCGLVMLLPHGYQGAGPEHSSARLERYLQLSAQENIQVCIPTTPAQIFHLLRRQIIRTFRKPLVVMSPKSVLRHKLAVSSLQELANGHFQPVIPEIDLDINPASVVKIIFCAGKVYYDLLEARRKDQLNTIALIRIEQLYPLPEDDIKAEFDRYPQAKTIVWCQEEPKNQGTWFYISYYLSTLLKPGQTLSYAGREASASPAVGYMSVHLEQQAALVKQALSS